VEPPVEAEQFTRRRVQDRSKKYTPPTGAWILVPALRW
jgi:hypothetical protein